MTTAIILVLGRYCWREWSMSLWHGRQSTSGAPPTRNIRPPWPGDELVTRPRYVCTNAITIHASAAQVWPWLVQGRGGLYSYDWLENLTGCDVHSGNPILPQCQTSLQVGTA